MLNRYSPGNIPFDKVNLKELFPHGFDDLVNHVKMHHERQGRSVSRDDIVAHFDKKSREMGMSVSQGRGFFGDLWNNVVQGAKNIGSEAWSRFKADPVGSLKAVSEALNPIISIGKELATSGAAA